MAVDFSTSYEYFEGSFKQVKDFVETYQEWGYHVLSLHPHKRNFFFWTYSVVVKKTHTISEEFNELLNWTPPHLKYPIL